MRRKCTGYIGLLAALALAAGLLSGCSGGSSASTASGNAAGSADTSYEMAVEEPAMAAEEDVIADGDTAYEPGMDGTSDGGAPKQPVRKMMPSRSSTPVTFLLRRQSMTRRLKN